MKKRSLCSLLKEALGYAAMRASANRDRVLQQRLQHWMEPWNHRMKVRRKLGLKSAIIELARGPIPTQFGGWTYIAFGDVVSGEHHIALVYGRADKLEDTNVMVRVHSACRSSEIFSAINCDCREQLMTAMEQIHREGSGVIIYLEQEGRGTGIVGKLAQLREMFAFDDAGNIIQEMDGNGIPIDTVRAYKQAGLPTECRDFSIAAEILRLLGVTSVRLLTNNPRKVAALKAANINVDPVEIHIPPANDFVAGDLRAKAYDLGHHISPEHYTRG